MQMLLCLVLTGVSCAGQRGLKLFSTDRGNGDPFDSAVDDLSNPEIFVVDRDAQALPAYIIRYSAR